MPLTETQAQQIVLLQALEQTRDNGGIWTAGDAKEATRAARSLVGPKASFADFLARRAQWAMEEVARRKPSQAFELRQPRWGVLAAWLLAATALLAGFATDYLASAQRIDIVEVPLVLLIAWNLAVFAAMFLGWLKSWVAGPGNSHLMRMIGRWRAGESFVLGPAASKPWATAMKKRWSELAVPINAARIKLAMNLSAALFALGALSSLFVRGIAKEYRAGWATTYSFVDAELLHTVVSGVLAPGAWLLGIAIPDAQHIAGLRMPPSQGEVAERWIFLYCASVLVWIVLPRLYLAAFHAFNLWRLRRAFALPVASAYFTTLRAAWRGQRIAVVAVPFRYELSPQLRNHLATMLERIYGLAVDIAIEEPVRMGEDRTDWKRVVQPEGHVAVIVVFNLAATAEAHAHGKLLKHLRASISRGIPLVALIDTGGYGQDDIERGIERDIERFRQRCNQWRQVLDSVKFKPVFIDLHKASDDDLQTLYAQLNYDE